VNTKCTAFPFPKSNLPQKQFYIYLLYYYISSQNADKSFSCWKFDFSKSIFNYTGLDDGKNFGLCLFPAYLRKIENALEIFDT